MHDQHKCRIWLGHKSETPSFGRRLTKDTILGDVLDRKGNTKKT